MTPGKFHKNISNDAKFLPHQQTPAKNHVIFAVLSPCGW